MKDAFAVIGLIVCLLFAFVVLCAVVSSVPNWFPGWRAERQRKAFARGQEYAKSLMAGNHDADILKMFPTMEGKIDELYRLRYINARLDESRYMGSGQVDHFDQGVNSIIRPLAAEHDIDDELHYGML